MPEIIITEWKPFRRNSLRGFLTAELPSGLILHEIAVHQSDNGPWAGAPSKPQVGRDGTVLKAPDGKLKFTPIVSFTDKATRDRWSAAVIAALLTAHPDALEGACA